MIPVRESQVPPRNRRQIFLGLIRPGVVKVHLAVRQEFEELVKCYIPIVAIEVLQGKELLASFRRFV